MRPADAGPRSTPTEFVVESIRARQLRSGDADEFDGMHRDPAVMRTLGGVRDRAATDAYMARNLAHWDRWGFGMYRLGDLADDRAAGRAGVRHAVVEGREELELGYALRASFWGRGLAVSIAEQLVCHAAAARLADSIVAFTLATHHRSRRVMEKAGFTFEREFRRADRGHVLYRRTLPRVQ